MKLKQLITASMIVAGLPGFTTVKAQYYYKDIVTNKELQTELARLKEQKIKTINVTSLESNGTPSEGFFCQKKYSKNYTESELVTSTSTSYTNYFTSHFTKEGLLKQTVDSSEVASSTANYVYDDKQQLVKVTSSTNFAADNSDDDPDKNSEQHIYEYENGLLKKLRVIINSKDTTLYLFQADEKNNISIEKNARTGDIYYYYYDSKQRLTDIVHSYGLNKALMPDFKFDYNSSGLLAYMIATEKDGAEFNTWKYNYENGLRTMERCYSKDGHLNGSVEYEYK